jgi:hypothetical protein
MSAVVAGIVPYLEQRSVPLLLLSREEREHPELFSGTLVTVGGRYFICAAAHSIKGADIGQIVPVVAKRLTGERVLLLGHGYRGGGDHDDLDIGWIEVDQRHPDLAAYHFVPVGQMVRGVSEIRGDMAVLSGCPQETVPRDLALRGHYQLRAMHYVTVTKAMAEWPATCRPENDIVLDYPDHDNVLQGNVPFDLPDAPGISGGGIWALNLNSAGLWSPERMRLIGVEHSWNVQRRYVRGSQLQHWLDMVHADAGVEVL